MKMGYTIGDVMTQNPVVVNPEDTLRAIGEIMNNYKVNAVIVSKEKDVLGIITEQDIIRKTIAMGLNPLEVKASEIMENNLITISPDKDIQKALHVMGQLNIRHLPVLESGEFVGLLTLKDIMRIQPQLMELISDKLNVREEELKPLDLVEGICNFCGNFTEKLYKKGGCLICKKCMD